jgi:hypothetical protein
MQDGKLRSGESIQRRESFAIGDDEASGVCDPGLLDISDEGRRASWRLAMIVRRPDTARCGPGASLPGRMDHRTRAGLTSARSPRRPIRDVVRFGRSDGSPQSACHLNGRPGVLPRGVAASPRAASDLTCRHNSVIPIPRWVISRSSQIDRRRRHTEDDQRCGPAEHRTGLDTIPAGRRDSQPLLRLAGRATCWTISVCRYHPSLGTLYGQFMVEFLFCGR